MKIRAFCAMALILLATSAFADSVVTTGTWYNLAWNGPVGTQTFNGSGDVGTTDPGAPNWTINAASPLHIFVIDCCVSGDRFTVVDNGVTLGTTPVPTTSDSCFGPPAGCVGNPGMSQGSFDLFAGANSIQIFLGAESGTSGEAYFRIDAPSVPEPSSLLLLGTGALGLFVPIRRKLLPRWI